MTEITYKEKRPDPSQYLELFETAGWHKVYHVELGEMQRALEHTWYMVVAYDGPILVGIGRVVSDGVMYGMIYDMIVRPSHQNKGIGTAILRMLVEKWKSTGLREIQLFSAKGKALFYFKRGFEKRPDDAPGMRLIRE